MSKAPEGNSQNTADGRTAKFRTFSVTYSNEPWRDRTFKVRGICQFDVLNPCWDNRPDDKPGLHWGAGPACSACTCAALKASSGAS